MAHLGRPGAPLNETSTWTFHFPATYKLFYYRGRSIVGAVRRRPIGEPTFFTADGAAEHRRRRVGDGRRLCVRRLYILLQQLQWPWCACPSSPPSGGHRLIWRRRPWPSASPTRTCLPAVPRSSLGSSVGSREATAPQRGATRRQCSSRTATTRWLRRMAPLGRSSARRGSTWATDIGNGACTCLSDPPSSSSVLA